jgi:hypothetical protein
VLQHLDAPYVAQAEKDVALKLSRGCVRLAAMLNRTLNPGGLRRRAVPVCVPV